MLSLPECSLALSARRELFLWLGAGMFPWLSCWMGFTLGGVCKMGATGKCEMKLRKLVMSSTWSVSLSASTFSELFDLFVEVEASALLGSWVCTLTVLATCNVCSGGSVVATSGESDVVAVLNVRFVFTSVGSRIVGDGCVGDSRVCA